MTEADKKTLKTYLISTGIALIVIIALFFGVSKCSAQSLTVQLTEQQEAIMLEAHGADWQLDLQAKLEQALRNHLSSAKEVVLQRKANLIQQAEGQDKVELEAKLEEVKVKQEAKRKLEEEVVSKKQ